MRGFGYSALLLCFVLLGCDGVPPNTTASSKQSEAGRPIPALPETEPTAEPAPTGATPAPPAQVAVSPVAQILELATWPRPQARIRNFDAAKKPFWSVYAKGGTELYCRFKFDSAAAANPTKQARPLNIEHVYPADLIAQAYGYPDRDCRKAAYSPTDARCAAAVADLHNLFPSYTKTNSSRQTLRYATLPKGARPRFIDDGCPDFRRDSKRTGEEVFVQPTPDARGDIARAVLYMIGVYALPLDGAISDADLLIEWHEQDPPDAEEQARELEIRKLQGTWNPLVLPAP